MKVFEVSGNKGGKGGGGGSPIETENNLFSQDLMLLSTGVSEGPVYRINPNDISDIEINESVVTDFIDEDTGKMKADKFIYVSRNGTVNQSALPVFGEETSQSQAFASPVVLKNGNLNGVPSTKVSLQPTSAFAWEALRFKFLVSQLAKMDEEGNVFEYQVGIKITVFKSDGVTPAADPVRKTISGKTNVPYKFDVEVNIVEYDSDGYRFTIEKTTSDSSSSRVQDTIAVVSWQEIDHDPVAYPRTAVVSYALEAHNTYTGNIPRFTSMVKGLVVKVPSNYDQPILQNEEIDWREIEVPASGDFAYSYTGYRQTSTGSTLKYSQPVIYRGVWDGSFVYSWTQNPVWILYDLLTNDSYGLGINEENIDKYKFYEAAQYCDACDAITGKFIGVNGRADGGYRYKPRTYFTSARQKLDGLAAGTEIKERRFTWDGIIANRNQGFEIIEKICATIRATLIYTPNGLSINMDKPNEVPSVIFNETNILKDSFTISGTPETGQLTGVEVSFVDPNNHFKRESIKIDDDKALRERNMIENIASVDLFGVTRRSQAMRYAQYLLASNKFQRRFITFGTDISALDLIPGDVVAVQQRQSGTSWGYGGKIRANTTVGTSNVYLEHFSSPAITNNAITANTLPIALRITKLDRDTTDLYLLSNVNFSSGTTAYVKNIHKGTYSNGENYQVTEVANQNVSAGLDFIDFVAEKRFNVSTKTFDAFSSFDANTQPVRGDIWNYGEVNPSDFYGSTTDKLFKVTQVKRDSTEVVKIDAVEYISNVYIDSETSIAYMPVQYKSTFSPLKPPVAPNIDLDLIVRKNADGSVRYDLDVSDATNMTDYPIEVNTEFEMAKPDGFSEIEGIN